MCGITGFIDPAAEREEARHVLELMSSCIEHRGPDDHGVWQDGTIHLAHRRLSIVELSPLGHQPMISASGRYVLVFNGEIYNHASLRTSLKSFGHQFKGLSDTEVLLALIEQFGIVEALTKCVGMFALALWDRFERYLYLARDRFGEKPLYYGWHQGVFIFGSELKAMMAHPAFQKLVDRDSLASLFRFGFVPAPHSIFCETYKVRPGTIIKVRAPLENESTAGGTDLEEFSYWSHEQVMLDGLCHPFQGTYDEAMERLEELLLGSVTLQLAADVPVGAFLSGGIDSSTVVALLQRVSPQPVRTFSIGFFEDEFDEARFAKAVAQYLGTKHVEFYVHAKEALELIPALARIYDEPLGDSSAIPTHMVARLARTEITVALTGDGGDELFYGYSKYVAAARFARLQGHATLGRIVGALPWNMIEKVGAWLPYGSKLTRSRARSLQRLLTSAGPRAALELVAEFCHDPSVLVPGSKRQATTFDRKRPDALESSFERMAMLLDREMYLPDDVLVKVDRATMAVGLETRAPLLDHRIAEFLATLPIGFIDGGGTQKCLLRDLLFRYVPRPLVDRPKRGFSIPLSQWLRGPLKGWVIDLLESRKGIEYIDKDRCRDVVKVHLRGEKDMSSLVWTLVMYLAWAEEWL